MKRFVRFLYRYKKKIIDIIILLLFIIFIFLIVCPGGTYKINMDNGTYNMEDESNVPYLAEMYTKNVKFSDKGITFLYKHIDEVTGVEIQEEKTSSEMALIVWNKMLDNDSCILQYIDNVDELEKLMKAEVITQYPKLDTPVDLNGTIEFYRHDENGNEFKLEYKKPEDFKKIIEDKNIVDAKKYYTLDENDNLLVGVVQSTTEKLTSNDPEIKLTDYPTSLEEANTERTDYSVYYKTINYKNVVKKYTMPFQYLWALTVIGDDKYVALDIVDLLVEKSDIDISIYDNITTTTNRATYNYKKEKKVDVSATATATTNGYGTFTKSESWEPANEWKEDEEFEVVHTVIYNEDTLIIDITKADVWIVDYSKSYKYNPKTKTSEETINVDLDDTEYENKGTKTSTTGSDLDYYDKFSDKLQDLVSRLSQEVSSQVTLRTDEMGMTVPLGLGVSITSCSSTYYQHNVDRKEEDYTRIDKQEYKANTTKNKPKVQKKTDEEIKNGTGQDNFVTILCDEYHRSARFNITTDVPSWLFELLESNPDTVNMVELTKYLLNKILGRDKFPTDYTFDEFENNSFIEPGSYYGNNFEEKVWWAFINAGFSKEAAAGAMGNFMQESGFKSNNLQDSYNTKWGISDEEYTNQINSGSRNFIDGAGYGLAQWTFSTRKQGLINLAHSKGVGIDNEDMQIEYLFMEINAKGCPGWRSATSPESACIAFELEFEQAGTPMMDRRVTYAIEIYNKYKDQTAPSDGGTTGGSSGGTGGVTGGISSGLTGDNAKKMNAMLAEARRIAEDNRYTYSQSNRMGEWQFDCSSFVYRLYKEFFGINVPITTSAYGSQYRIGTPSAVTLQPGDVLWKSGHVTLYLGNGVYVAAHGEQGHYATHPEDQISIKNENPNKYTYVYRFITAGS